MSRVTLLELSGDVVGHGEVALVKVVQPNKPVNIVNYTCIKTEIHKFTKTYPSSDPLAKERPKGCTSKALMGPK